MTFFVSGSKLGLEWGCTGVAKKYQRISQMWQSALDLCVGVCLGTSFSELNSLL